MLKRHVVMARQRRSEGLENLAEFWTVVPCLYVTHITFTDPFVFAAKLYAFLQKMACKQDKKKIKGHCLSK